MHALLKFGWLRVCLLMLGFLLVSNCTSAKTVPTSQTLSPDVSSGLMLVSVFYSGGYSGYNMHFREVGQEKWQSLTIGSTMTLLPASMMDWDIEEPGLRGQVFAVRLKPGNYEFFSWHVGSGYFHTRPVNDFSIGFSIEAGATYYVGSFGFLKQRTIGAAVTGVNVQHSNQWERDQRIFESKYSEMELGELRRVASDTQLSEYLGDGNSTKLILSPIIHIPIY